jgi:hypothetical protein
MTTTEQNERKLDQTRSDAVAPKPRNKMKKDLAAELSIPGLVLDPCKFKYWKSHKKWLLLVRASFGSVSAVSASLVASFGSMDEATTNAALPLPRRTAGLCEKEDLNTGCQETTQKQKHQTQEVARTKPATTINPCPRVAIQAHKCCRFPGGPPASVKKTI